MVEEGVRDIRRELQQLTDSKLVIASVYAMLLSFFYNLPVMTYSARGSNELRLYDVAGIFVMYVYFTNFQLINSLIFYRKTLSSLFYFLLWCTATFLFTVMSSILDDKLFWAIQSLLYLFHFWSFFIGSVLLVIVMQNMKQLKRIATVTLFAGSITFLIVVLQNFEIIPFLWNESYASNYHSFLSGTLGPNKIVLGMTCLMLFAFAVGLLNEKRVKVNKILLLMTIGLSAVVLVISGSRTSYVGIAVFLAYFSVRETKHFIYSGVILALVLWGIASINTEVLDKAISVYEGRVENKIKNPDDLREGKLDDLYEDLGSGRKGLSIWYLDLVMDNLIIIPFGKGFNNRLETFSSAHNIYLSLIYEVGLFGVFLYVRWLIMYLFVRLSHFPQLRMALKGLVLAMMVTLLFGEHLYIYRPVFGLLGLFLFITTILSSPIFILDSNEKKQAE